MSRYAIVKQGAVIDVVLWDGMSAWSPASGTAVPIPDGVVAGIGWTYDGTFVEPPVDPEVLWAAVRERRDALLAASDWTQVADAPVDQQAWAVYRQTLRDIPQDFATPDAVVWPEAP